jgi:alkaline phosphatase
MKIPDSNEWSVFLACLVLPVVLTALWCPAAQTPQAKYVFLFIGDGMGLPHVQAAEEYLQSVSNSPKDHLVMTAFPAQGFSTTDCKNNYMTDSAASGTALASGYKTAYSVLGIDETGGTRFVTMAEYAKRCGKKIGIISSASVTEATPAAFYAHQPQRYLFYPIGYDLITSGFDFFGGGDFNDPEGRHVPMEHVTAVTNSLQACIKSTGVTTGVLSVVWHDIRDLAQSNGYLYVTNQVGFTALSPGCGRVIAIHPQQWRDHSFPYVIDEPEHTPTLADFTAKAIELLDNPDGFFIAVEGAKIDWAAHPNDGATTIKETIAFDDAVAVAQRFYEQHPDQTLVIVTADHETGGLTTGHSGARFDVLQHQNISFQLFNRRFTTYRKTHTMRNMVSRIFDSVFQTSEAGKQPASFDDVKPMLQECFGLGDNDKGLKLSRREWRQLERAFIDSMQHKKLKPDDELILMLYGGQEPLTITAMRILNAKAGLRWSTFSHSGAAVPVFALGVGREQFNGYYDNTDIPRFIMNVLLPETPFPLPTEPFTGIPMNK